MKWKKKGSKVDIYSWCENPDKTTNQQVLNLAAHPKVYHHVALMADCHQGYGMPIGGVIACDDAIIPHAVGVDIGCGMAALQTYLSADSLNKTLIRSILNELKNIIPLGFKNHKENQSWTGFKEAPDIPVINKLLKDAAKQLGTLGGGNHFIEIQEADDGFIWLMIHTGSRDFGYKIAEYYHKEAERFCQDNSLNYPGKGAESLAYLPFSSNEGKEYFAAMQFAMKFARENRRRILEIFSKVMEKKTSCYFGEEINIHHNFAARESHFGKKLIIHRKGATEAFPGQKGIIPGSMGSKSFITEGLGNQQSFMSCSHGAGRIMSRNKFNRTYSEDECNKQIKNIEFSGWSRDRKGNPDLSEAPAAYKDIDEIIDAQSDLVKPLVTLNPLGVLKG